MKDGEGLVRLQGVTAEDEEGGGRFSLEEVMAVLDGNLYGVDDF